MNTNTQLKAPSITVLAGAAALVLGAFLPWAKLSAGILSVEKSGFDRDGLITFAIGLAVVACVFFWRNWVAIGALGLAALAVALYDIIDTLDKDDTVRHVGSLAVRINVSLGIGLVLTLAAAVVVCIGAVLLRASDA